MSNIITQSILGQSLEVVQKSLGPVIHHQSNPEKQTDYYVHGVSYLRDVFPVSLSGIIGVYRKERCIAVRIILNKRDPRYTNFVYNREIASRLFAKAVSHDYAYWHQIEAEPRANNALHYVYCMGSNVATTWDAAAIGGTLKSDVIMYLDTRCGETDHSVVSQPFASTSGGTASGTSQSSSPPIAIGLNRLDSSQPSAAKTFPDIAGNIYEVEILKAANTYHLLNGFEDGTFKPDNPITREQAINLLMGAMELMVVDAGAIAIPDELEKAPFVDVPADHRSARQFYYAKQIGILSGDNQNKAQPNASLTRAELIVLIHNGLQVVVNENFSTVTDLGDAVEMISPDANFDDIADHWSEQIVRQLATYGIATPLDESGTKFFPDTAAKRNYTAAALVRMLEVKFIQCQA